jgi:threonine aldolase
MRTKRSEAMPTSRGRKTAATGQDEIRRVYESCTRFLGGSGKRDAASLLATIPEDTALDVYGFGGVVEQLESEVATLLGKDAAVFFITGTMAQQATLRIHADRRARTGIVFHPACHLDVREERAYERLHGLVGITCGPAFEPLTSEQLATVADPVAALVVELPQRDLGGTLPTWEELVAQVEWAEDRGAAAHLDGARLWEAMPFYEESAGATIDDVASLFDTVYVSFYKGLGGIAGCCVAGDAETIGELRLWRVRHGGRAYGLWPYAASARTVLAVRARRFASYYRRAQQIARGLQRLDGVEVLPFPVQSPMMHVRLYGERGRVMERMLDIARTEGIWMFGGPYATEGPNLQRFEFNVGEATMGFQIREVSRLFEDVLSG